jgi:hypothetical protein
LYKPISVAEMPSFLPPILLQMDSFGNRNEKFGWGHTEMLSRLWETVSLIQSCIKPEAMFLKDKSQEIC